MAGYLRKIFACVCATFAPCDAEDEPSSGPACTRLLSGFVTKRQASMDAAAVLEVGATASTDVRTAVLALDLATALRCTDAALEFMKRHPVSVAHLAEEVANHPDCISELETKSQAETRCTQKLYKIGIHALRAAGLTTAADAMWNRATTLRTASGKASAQIMWPSTLQTPTVWISGLRQMPVWNCNVFPFVSALEAAAPQLLTEIGGVAARFEAAYPYLQQRGSWQNLFLQRSGAWDKQLCQELPLACRLLIPELPTKPDVPFATVYHEEVVIFLSKPSASVSMHCGSSNAVINLHLTLAGARGSKLHVATESIELQDGRAVCFSDGFDHGFEHPDDGEPERISLVVRVMHPELSLASYHGAAQTDVVDLAKWDVADALALEVDRLRSEYRQLVWARASHLEQRGTSATCLNVAAGSSNADDTPRP